MGWSWGGFVIGKLSEFVSGSSGIPGIGEWEAGIDCAHELIKESFYNTHGHRVAQQVEGMGCGWPFDCFAVALCSSTFGDRQMSSSGAEPISLVESFG